MLNVLGRARRLCPELHRHRWQRSGRAPGMCQV